MERLTIKDLAKMLSVTPSTISRALNDHPAISSATKRKVRQAAQQFNYIPNQNARYFRKKNSGLIALILPEFNMFFTPGVLAGIQEAIDLQNHSVIVFCTNNNIEKEKEIVQYCLSLAIEGVLMILSDHTSNLEHIDRFIEPSIPVVLMDKIIETDKHSIIHIDDCKASYDATLYLINHGYKNILGVFSDSLLNLSKGRIEGFKKCLKEHSLPCGDLQVLINRNPDLLEEELNSILSLKNRPDAFFIMSDELMVKGYRLLDSYRISHKKPIGIICISDGIAPYIFPNRITHLRHSGHEIGYAGGKLLVQLLTEKSFIPIKVEINTHIVELDSVTSTKIV